MLLVMQDLVHQKYDPPKDKKDPGSPFGMLTCFSSDHEPKEEHVGLGFWAQGFGVLDSGLRH